VRENVYDVPAGPTLLEMIFSADSAPAVADCERHEIEP